MYVTLRSKAPDHRQPSLMYVQKACQLSLAAKNSVQFIANTPSWRMVWHQSRLTISGKSMYCMSSESARKPCGLKLNDMAFSILSYSACLMRPAERARCASDSKRCSASKPPRDLFRKRVTSVQVTSTNSPGAIPESLFKTLSQCKQGLKPDAPRQSQLNACPSPSEDMTAKRANTATIPPASVNGTPDVANPPCDEPSPNN